MAKIGVFVCHCGENIAAHVRVGDVAKAMAGIPGVRYSVDYKYMCADPGQSLLKNAVKDHKLDGVVIVACSPHMHERTFRNAVAKAGLNPFLCEIANVREHCSWVHDNIDEATAKAIDIAKFMVEKVKKNLPLYPIKIPVTKHALVIGGGIAGIQTALDIARSGHKVTLVEREPSIGGNMSRLSETFPTLDCSSCILTPRMVEVAAHPNIRLLTYSEVESVDGYIGNFKVSIRKKARYAREADCTSCGLCWEKCPQRKISSEFDQHLGVRTAIYIPFPQAVPAVPVIDTTKCPWFTKGAGKCGICAKVCGPKCIDFDMKDEIIEDQFGAIVLATGFDLYTIDKKPDDSQYKGYGEYGHGRFKDVVDGLQFERLCSASGPTSGEVRRPSDGKTPETVVFIECVGSRDPEKGIEYCSKICCMYTAKHAMLYKHKVHHGQAYVFYMDIRAGGKDYEEFVRRGIEQDGTIYIRGRVSRLYERNGKVVVKGADTITGRQVEIEADLVVAATAILPRPDAEKMAQMAGISYDKHGFFKEAHPKLGPVETTTAGVFLAGACQGPKDIPETVAQGSAVASKVAQIFANELLEREPIVAKVNEPTCVACYFCKTACPYTAISEKEIKDRQGNVVRVIAHVNEGLCTGCGVCEAICPSNTIELQGYTDEQMFAEINAI
jgi:heterodisulfide reductase subunit A